MKPLKLSSTNVEEALRFARETADAEIASIERLHNRTLKALGWVLTALAVVGGLVGWMGFNNLRQSVLLNTTRVTEQMVRSQLEAALTKEKIDAGVKTALAEESKAGLQTAIRSEVAPAVKAQLQLQTPQIEKLVNEHTSAIANEAIRERLLSRSLSASQENALLRQLKFFFGNGTGKEVEIHTDGSAEELNYASQFQRVFQAAGWKVLMGGMVPNEVHGSGLALGVMDNRTSPDTKNLQQALFKGGIDARIVDAVESEYINDNHTRHPILFVLPHLH